MIRADHVRPIRPYEDPIGVALESATTGSTVKVRLDGSAHGSYTEFHAADEIAINELVALDAGFWTWLIGGTRQALAAWLRRLARRLDYRP